MKRTLILIFACIALSVQAQDNTRSLRFGYVNYDSVLTSMPDYTLCQKQMADLRAKYDAEQKRVEDEFNRKYEEFLDGQKEFPPTILLKRQTELKELMERNIAFRQEGLDDLSRAEAGLMAPLRQRLSDVLAGLARERGLAFILNTSVNAVPFIDPAQGVDLNQPAIDALK